VFQTTICLRLRPVSFGMENPSGIAAQVAAVLDEGLTFQCVTPAGLQARLPRCMTSPLSCAVLMRKRV
jgi:hypothetical protein